MLLALCVCNLFYLWNFLCCHFGQDYPGKIKNVIIIIIIINHLSTNSNRKLSAFVELIKQQQQLYLYI